MGNSESAPVTAAAAGGAIQARIKKEKSRAKKLGCCCCWCNIASLVFMVVGIVLLVYFAASLGKNFDVSKSSVNENTAKGLSYTGIAFLCLGFLLLLIGIIFALALWVTYRKLNGKTSHKTFVPQKYAPGTAPYPQQDWGEQQDPGHPAGSPVPPTSPGYGATDDSSSAQLIKPEIK